MTDRSYVLSALLARWPLNLLSLLLAAFGVMLIVVVILFTHHVGGRLSSDAKGIDLVVGAKGSPLQLVLSSVYHVDVPTGNIDFAQAQKLLKDPQFRFAIPLALGDRWHAFRIVGTTPDYMRHYGAALETGDVWNAPFEAVVGADVPLQLGERFVGAHGLSGHGTGGDGHVHESSPYTVTGRLARSGTVLDRLILTSVESVWMIHGQSEAQGAGHGQPDQHEHHEHGDDHDHEHSHSHDHAAAAKPEITAILLGVRSPAAMMNLPRQLNRDTGFLAAHPALEMARLGAVFGVGRMSGAVLSGFLIVVAAFGIFAGLASGLEQRAGDIAVLRALGYTPLRIFGLVAAEGALLAFAGAVCGVVFGAAGFAILIRVIKPLQDSGAHVGPLLAQGALHILLVCGAVVVVGVLAALIPALRCAKTSIVKQLIRA